MRTDSPEDELMVVGPLGPQPSLGKLLLAEMHQTCG
eukprot:SAG22_NODE_8083_length_685_cov_0.796928_3_plen_35_part_01